MAYQNYTKYLTREQRLKRVGELFAKGIFLYQMRRNAEVHSQAEEQASEDSTVPSNTDGELTREEEVCRYLSRVGSARPKDIQSFLQTSKATAFRSLSRLEQEKRIVKTGSGAGVRISLAEK